MVSKCHPVDDLRGGVAFGIGRRCGRVVWGSWWSGASAGVGLDCFECAKEAMINHGMNLAEREREREHSLSHSP